MKAIEEIGINKALKFFISCFYQIIYHLLIDHIFNFPQARALMLGVSGSQIQKESIIMNVRFLNLHHTGFRGLEIGKNCFLADEVMIDLYDKVKLEDDVTLAQRVLVLTHTNVGYHDHPLQKFFPKKSCEVLIKQGSVIGAGSILLPGITIGKESFVAAGSVVTEDVPERTLVGGTPAKIIRKIK